MSERDIRDIPLSVHRRIRITNVFRGAQAMEDPEAVTGLMADWLARP